MHPRLHQRQRLIVGPPTPVAGWLARLWHAHRELLLTNPTYTAAVASAARALATRTTGRDVLATAALGAEAIVHAIGGATPEMPTHLGRTTDTPTSIEGEES